MLDFAPEVVVESLESGRIYPKKAVISYLTGLTIAECHKDGDSGKLIECIELTILIRDFGLLPLGHVRARRFLGQHIIDAEIRRATDTVVKSEYARAAYDRHGKRKNEHESVGSSEGSGGEPQG